MEKIIIKSKSVLGKTKINELIQKPTPEAQYKVISKEPLVIELTITDLVYRKLISDIFGRFRLRDRFDYEVEIK